MNIWEEFALKYTGLVIVIFGFLGAVGAICIDTYRGYPFHIGHLQIIGVIIFGITMVFGVFVDRFLKSVKEMLNKYLRQ